MATSVLEECPRVDYSYTDELGVSILQYGGIRGKEQRARNQALQMRSYTWPMERTDTERQAIDEFFRLRNQTTTSFYIRDPKDNARTGVLMGGVTSGVTFTLPVVGENTRDYWISGATATVYINGIATAQTVTIDTDNRRIILTSAPGDVVTADYHYYRRVRLDGTLDWVEMAPNWWEVVIDLVEVRE